MCGFDLGRSRSRISGLEALSSVPIVLSDDSHIVDHREMIKVPIANNTLDIGVVFCKETSNGGGHTNDAYSGRSHANRHAEITKSTSGKKVHTH